MRTTKTAADFQTAAQARGITVWPIRDCSMCGYELSYQFRSGDVAFDTGCWCSRRLHIEPRSWADVADHYNMQSSASVIARYDEFWGFAAPEHRPEAGGEQ